MKSRRIAGVALIVACGMLLTAGGCGDSAEEEPSTGSIYWGATIKSEVYGGVGGAPYDPKAWDLFEAHAGKEVTLVNQGQPWGGFDLQAMQLTHDRGAIPAVTMPLDAATLDGVIAGDHDAEIREWARQAKEWGHPFLFRPWWEMNGDDFPWARDPDYVAAWRHFHDLVVAEGATNVTWAWIVNGIWSDPRSEPAPYYPGDAYVDWVGMDSYNYGENPNQPDRWETPKEVLNPTLRRLKQIAPGKPVCVWETASTEFGGDKAAWIRTLLNDYLPRHPEIKAFLWFNWNVLHPKGRADWPIESSASAQRAFRTSISSSTYRSTLPTQTRLEKVPLP